MHALGYTLIYLLPAVYLVGLALGGPWWLLTPATVFGLVPLLDGLLGHDEADPDDAEMARRAKNPLYDLLLRAWVPTQLVMIGLGLALFVSPEATLIDRVGVVLAAGILTGGGGINIAHELMHRKAALDRALAEVLMTSVTYTHFCVEHVHGHHRRVATPEDPATSRLGEGFYTYYPRVLLGSVRSFWHLERERNARRGVPPTSPRDRRLRYGLVLLAVYGTLAAVAGPLGLLFFAAQSVIAFTLLELVNYVEHYGLQRRQTASGRYERVQPHHSWNATHAVTNRFLFNLQRHADHHAFASRPYYHLRSWPDAPSLPFGYPTMILLALLPPLWRAVMDPRVEAVRAGGVTDPTGAPPCRASPRRSRAAPTP